MSTTEQQQALAVKALEHEVSTAERDGFFGLHRIQTQEGRAVLDALAAAQQESQEWKAYGASLRRHLDKQTEAARTMEARAEAAEAARADLEHRLDAAPGGDA